MSKKSLELSKSHAASCACINCSKRRALEEKKISKRLVAKETRPWASGFNGHAKSCECLPCTKQRVEAHRQYVKSCMSKTLDMPDASKTVFVRPHWRRQKNHLKDFPVFRKALIRVYL